MENVRIDLVSDWNNIVSELITLEKLDIPQNETLKQKSLYLNNYRRRKGTRSHYKVHKSKEFSCPSHCIEGLKKLEKVFEEGGDLAPYLSRRARTLKKDLMFNSWGIVHFHLGTNVLGDGYIERTGPLLYAYLKESNVYFIDVVPHQQWANTKYIQIIHSNWPELTSPFIMKLENESQNSYPLTDEQHLKIREGGGNTFIELQDDKLGKVILAPPGGGISTSGIAVNDVIESDFMIMRLKEYEKDIKLNAEVIQNILEKETGIKVDPLDIQLVLDEEQLCFKENTVDIHLIIDFVEPTDQY